MTFYIDDENANQNYSYATFEESIGGRPIFIFKQEVSLLIPVINQGIYDLATFNGHSQIPIYCDKSYYLFKGVSECAEAISIRGRGTINGEFENKFRSTSHSANARSFYVELELGFNGEFTYAGGWRVKATEFGVLIPENSNQSEDEKTFFKEVEGLTKDDLDFLLNKRQPELEDFVATL
jgi:hypothetical protein